MGTMYCGKPVPTCQVSSAMGIPSVDCHCVVQGFWLWLHVHTCTHTAVHSSPSYAITYLPSIPDFLVKSRFRGLLPRFPDFKEKSRKRGKMVFACMRAYASRNDVSQRTFLHPLIYIITGIYTLDFQSRGLRSP